MKTEIEALVNEREEQVILKEKAHNRIVAIDSQIRQLRTLEKKMNKVLGNLKGNEIPTL